MVQHRVRVRFSKQHDLRLISHRDLLRVFERLFRRAGIELSMSEGFHPKPRMNFPSALALGIVGLDEVVELDLAQEVQPAELLAALAAQAPPGLSFSSVDKVELPAKKVQAKSQTFEVPVPRSRSGAAASRVAEFCAAASYVIPRDRHEGTLDVRPLVESLELADGVLRMTLRVTHEAGARPRDILAALGLEDLDSAGQFLTRTRVELNA